MSLYSRQSIHSTAINLSSCYLLQREDVFSSSVVEVKDLVGTQSSGTHITVALATVLIVGRSGHGNLFGFHCFVRGPRS